MSERRIAGGAQAPVASSDQGRASPLPIVLAAVVGVLLIVIISVMVLGQGGQTTTSAPTALPVPTLRPPTPVVPTAPPTTAIAERASDNYAALIEAAIRAGQYREATTIAESALAVEDITVSERRMLTGYLVTASLKDIATQPACLSDAACQEHLVDRYLALVARANGAGVEIETPLQVARSAQASSQFGLARVAIEQAYAAGDFDARVNRDVTRLYVSVLFGLGKWYTEDTHNEVLFIQGVRWLVTSDAVAQEYKTGQSEAEALLRERGYPDRTRWPAPFLTPLLK